MDEADVSVETLVDRGRNAQPAWAALPFSERARMLRRLAARIRSDEALVGLIAAETGKPAFEAFGFEVAYVSELVRFLSGRHGRAAIAAGARASLIFPHKRARVVWQPRGVVAVIGPWNFPLLNNFGDAVAPLLAGNSVVLKPSPHAPRTSLHVQALWRELGLPEGVFQVAVGGPETGSQLVDGCDMVFFTGSVAAGRQIAAQAGERLIPCVAELGGKSAMIVLADADLPAAARAAVWGAFAGAGQVCIRPERVLVERRVADEFVRLVLAEVAAIRQGGGPDCDVGRVVVPAQIERYRKQIDDAVERGAHLLVGGAFRADGADVFFSPTVLDHVSPDATVAREETFGPVLPIVRVADADEAVRLTNASTLGLSGAVWSADARAAAALARRLVTGSVCINDVLINYFFVSAPLGAARRAGLGFRHGAEALRQFCYPQSIVEDRPGLGFLARWIRKQMGFPYRQRFLDVLRGLMKVIYR
jgi:acyl-CoA reductase-like NAD-dependent aldehyde dehydrogenase